MSPLPSPAPTPDTGPELVNGEANSSKPQPVDGAVPSTPTTSENSEPLSLTGKTPGQPTSAEHQPENHATEEDGDEPDCMVTSETKPRSSSVSTHSAAALNFSKHSTDFSQAQNSRNDFVNVDDEMEEEGKLVIDDCNNTSSTPSRHGLIQNANYSCQICSFTTSSSKVYLHHCNDAHNFQATIYECDMCDYATIYKHKLPRHRKLHLSDDSGMNSSSGTLDLTDKMDDRVNNFLGVHAQSISRLGTPDSSRLNETSDMEEGTDEVQVHPGLNVMSMSSMSMPLTITTDNIDQVLDEDKKKKKKTRQEVDPGKYFEAVDGSGTKYACSQCGNIYKWRKSLNKHWKEKHLKDPLVEEPSPPGMLELLKSGKYTQLGARRIYDNAFLATIKTQKDDGNARPPSSSGSDEPNPSPPNFLSTPQSIQDSIQNSINARLAASGMMPMSIGPFVANSQAVFPGMPPMLGLHHLAMPNFPRMPLDNNALDLTQDMVKPEASFPGSPAPQDMQTSFDQDAPLDFSKKSPSKESTVVKNENVWDDQAMKLSSPTNQSTPKIHRCSKCDYTSTSEIDFANHTSSHLNRRIVRCFECKIQLNSMDELNLHFIKLHNKKLSDHKEAIKKIPHGLQQTYHLLQMDIDKIGDLGTQDLGANDAKSLKCKKCDFEAKWPAELQKHAVSHSEERPYICMVCGSTYKWKWDLVKHFQKSHPNLANPYRRNDKRDSPDASSEDEQDDEPDMKRARHDAMNAAMMNPMMPYSRDDAISVEGIIAATQAGQRFVSSQPHLDGESSLERNRMALFSAYPFLANAPHIGAANDFIEKHAKAQKALQDNLNKSRPSGNTKKTPVKEQYSPGSTTSSSSRNEELPYKCTQCNYHARWPSEVTQHMKNHSDSKPYLCPRCDYRSKWKWDVVKHLKRCGGGGGIDDVIDTTKRKKDEVPTTPGGPPNAIVSQQGKIKKTTPQPPMPFIMPSLDEHGQPTALVLRQPHVIPGAPLTPVKSSGDLTSPNMMNNNNNNNAMVGNNNINNNYAAYSSGQPLPSPIPSATFTPIAPSKPMTSPSSSMASSTPLTQSTPVSHSSSRHNSSSEIWYCPHCPFTTPSQAELKRHSGLHSEDKPFKCDVCQYSTRWACDLKKHRKSYNHFPVDRSLINNAAAQEKPVTKEPEKVEKIINRFKCFQCKMYFPHLQSLMDHRSSVHIGTEEASPAPVAEENEIDAARIKHPRKPIKQMKCTKCDFVCRNRQTMDRHMEEHEQQEMNTLKCFYCTQQFKNKESLLDHIISHPTFNPKEWETFFMISEDDEEEELNKSIKSETDVIAATPQSKDANQPIIKVKSEESKPEATDARIQQILDEIPKQQKPESNPSQLSPGVHKYKCEWCPEEFINLTAVYKHASLAHPIQLKEQDVSQAMGVAHDFTPKRPIAIDVLRQQIADKTNQQMMEKFNGMFAGNPKMQDMMSKKLVDATSNRFQCDKCTFASSNPITFQRHYELHGSKQQFPCWFCDYAVDRMNLLYQHMKISHTRMWKAMSQDPKYASQIKQLNQAYAAPVGNNNDSPPGPTSTPAADGVMDLSAKPTKSEGNHDIVYQPRQQYTWSGIPVNVVAVGRTLNFVCPNCPFNDASIAKTCSHVMQSHRAMTKFKCKTCSFSDDNIHVMSDHCKTSHPINECIVEVVDFKQLNFSELQMVQLNAKRERMAQEMAASSNAERTDSNTDIKKSMNCPFCPYRSFGSEDMKSHLSNHSRQARYRCQMCDFSSDSTSVISEHVKVHDQSYSAVNRMVETNEPADLSAKVSPSSQTTPKMKSAGRMRYRCSACPYHTTCKSNILKHKRQHLHNKRYKCDKCSYSAARAVLLKKHAEAHEIPVEENGYHHDIFCNPNSPNDDLKSDNDEIDIDNDNDESIDIDDDDGSISDESEMDAKAIEDLEAKDIMEAEAAHKASMFEDDQGNGEDGLGDKPLRKQKCPHCPFSSNSGYEYRKHLGFHGTQERYKCDLCSYSLDRLNLLSQHRKLHCNEPNYTAEPPASSLLNTDFILKQNSDQTTEENDNVAQEDVLSVKTDDQEVMNLTKIPEDKKSEVNNNNSNNELVSPAAKDKSVKVYVCRYCDREFEGKDLMISHEKQHLVGTQ